MLTCHRTVRYVNAGFIICCKSFPAAALDAPRACIYFSPGRRHAKHPGAAPDAAGAGRQRQQACVGAVSMGIHSDRNHRLPAQGSASVRQQPHGRRTDSAAEPVSVMHSAMCCLPACLPVCLASNCPRVRLPSWRSAYSLFWVCPSFLPPGRLACLCLAAFLLAALSGCRAPSRRCWHSMTAS
jgi:hypothetical protein